jgi:hypothetical protein
MGILDKVKGLTRSHKKEVSSGIDKVADVAEDKLGHEKQVEKVADTVKDQLGVASEPKQGKAH